MSVLVDDRLTEINDFIVTITSRVDKMEKRIKELEFKGDVEELRGEMQVAVNSMTANVTKNVEAFMAKVEALENQLQMCMAMMAKLSNGGPQMIMLSNLQLIMKQGMCKGD